MARTAARYGAGPKTVTQMNEFYATGFCSSIPLGSPELFGRADGLSMWPRHSLATDTHSQFGVDLSLLSVRHGRIGKSKSFARKAMAGGLRAQARALLASNPPPQGLRGRLPPDVVPEQPLGGKRAPSYRVGFAREEGGGD